MPSYRAGSALRVFLLTRSAASLAVWHSSPCRNLNGPLGLDGGLRAAQRCGFGRGILGGANPPCTGRWFVATDTERPKRNLREVGIELRERLLTTHQHSFRSPGCRLR